MLSSSCLSSCISQKKKVLKMSSTSITACLDKSGHEMEHSVNGSEAVANGLTCIKMRL